MTRDMMGEGMGIVEYFRASAMLRHDVYTEGSLFASMLFMHLVQTMEHDVRTELASPAYCDRWRWCTDHLRFSEPSTFA